MQSTDSDTRSRHRRILLSKPQEELILDATRTGVFQELPDRVGKDHRQFLGIFGAPGLRGLTYVLVDGEPWPKTSEFRDYVTFQAPDADGRIDVRPFGQPASVAWRPDAGETDASISLNLHQYQPDTDTQYLAATSERGVETPHIVFGWHDVPDPSSEQGTREEATDE